MDLCYETPDLQSQAPSTEDCYILFFNEKVLNVDIAQAQYLLGSSRIVLAAISWAIYALA